MLQDPLDRCGQALARELCGELLGCEALDPSATTLARVVPRAIDVLAGQLHVALARVTHSEHEVVVMPVVGRRVLGPLLEAREILLDQRCGLIWNFAAGEALGVVGRT